MTWTIGAIAWRRESVGRWKTLTIQTGAAAATFAIWGAAFIWNGERLGLVPLGFSYLMLMIAVDCWCTRRQRLAEIELLELK